MPALTLSFKVHIPFRLQDCTSGNSGMAANYFNNDAAAGLINKLSDECYLPANKIMMATIQRYPEKFKLAFSISGPTIELLQIYRPDVIESFRQLAETGCVEILAETYYHSLSWLYSKKEFKYQVEKHSALIKEIFGLAPAVLRNTELIYNNELAKFAAAAGYKGILCEGLERILAGRTANQIYASPGNADFGLLLRNVSLSDDIAFRFDDKAWNEHPLTANKFASWIHAHTDAGNINLFMDYETFGFHKNKGTGILQFLENLPVKILEDDRWRFVLPTEALEAGYPKDVYDVPKTISWQDKEIASCVNCENSMQNNMLKKIYSMEAMLGTNGTDSDRLDWGHLQSADHFYYMSGAEKTGNNTCHALNPFDSAEAAYKNYLHIITSFEIKLIELGLSKFKGEHHYLKNTSLY